jgi:hypothetical protein
MPERTSRTRDRHWTLLTIFALANLLFWVGAAVVVGIVVGDEVDLGVETLIRQGQATAAAAWDQAWQPAPRSPRATATPNAPTQVQAASGQSGPATAPGATTVAWPTPSPTRPGAGIEIEPGTQAAEAVATPNSPPAGPTPQPQAAGVTRPLLLADPEINDLAGLDAEMDRSASGRPVQIRYREAALNLEIAALYQNNPDLPFRDVQVDLQPDRVVVTGKMSVLGFEVQAQVVGKLLVVDCLPQLQIQQVSVAGVMTPRFVRDRVEEMVLEAMTWYPADYPLCLEQIVLEETRATVYGHHRRQEME